MAWTQHGGSGLNVSVAQVMGMPVGDRDWFLERIAEQREHEAKAIRDAAKGK